MYKSITTAVAVLALASAGAGVAYAQTTSNSSTQTMNKSAMHGMHHMHGMRMQKRLAKLKAKLKITSSQAAAWDAFAKAAENMRPAMNSKMKRQAMSRTVPEAFKDMAMRAQQRAQKSQALAKAADNLYGKLSSQQKAAWNKAMAEMHAKMHHRWQKHRDMKKDSMHGMHGSAGGQG